MTLYAAVQEAMLAEKGIHPNLDFPTGPAYYLMGFDIPQFTPLFVFSRITGWTAHIIEQQNANSLIRPLSKYVGPESVRCRRTGRTRPVRMIHRTRRRCDAEIGCRTGCDRCGVGFGWSAVVVVVAVGAVGQPAADRVGAGRNGPEGSAVAGDRGDRAAQAAWRGRSRGWRTPLRSGRSSCWA